MDNSTTPGIFTPLIRETKPRLVSAIVGGVLLTGLVLLASSLLFFKWNWFLTGMGRRGASLVLFALPIVGVVGDAIVVYHLAKGEGNRIMDSIRCVGTRWRSIGPWVLLVGGPLGLLTQVVPFPSSTRTVIGWFTGIFRLLNSPSSLVYVIILFSFLTIFLTVTYYIPLIAVLEGRRFDRSIVKNIQHLSRRSLGTLLAAGVSLLLLVLTFAIIWLGHAVVIVGFVTLFVAVGIIIIPIGLLFIAVGCIAATISYLFSRILAVQLYQATLSDQ